MDLEKLAQVLIYFLEYPQDLKEVISFQKSIYKKIDESLKSDRFACEKGCYYCCLGWEVKATFPQMLILLSGLNLLSNDEKLRVNKELQSYKRLKVDDFTPCPLLKDGLCVVYDFRPVVCRLFSSYSSELCKRKVKFEFPEEVQNVAAEIDKELEKVDEFFLPFFTTKVSIKDIKFDEAEKLFYLSVFDMVLFKPLKDEIKVEKGEKFPF